MLRRAAGLITLLAIIAGGAATGTAQTLGAVYGRVEVAPTKTSIYVGSVSMTMPTFVRSGESFVSSYVATVFPYFFYNETGRLSVDLPEESLRQLERGAPVDFTGRAVREDGAERRVEGRATPSDARSGKLKVRVFYSKRIELIFNTTYRFPDAPLPQPGSP